MTDDSWLNGIGRASDARQKKNEIAREAIERAEAAVPLSNLANDILGKVDRLRELTAIGSVYGPGCLETQVPHLEEMIRELRTELNNLVFKE